MITLFSIPKAFKGHDEIIQRNALSSWVALPDCEIILFGQESGLAEVAAEFGVRHVPDIACNEHGTPLVSDAFAQVRNLASKPIVGYVNADIILMSDLCTATKAVADEGFNSWLISGQRYDIDIFKPLDFSNGWEKTLRNTVINRGKLHGKAGMDYFLFPIDFPIDFPPLAVGRPGWDSWFIYQTRILGIPVINALEAVIAVHQNHPPSYKPFCVEARQNTHSAGGVYRMGTLRDANWRLKCDNTDRIVLTRNWIGTLFFLSPVRGILAVKRWVQKKIADLKR